MGWSIFTLMVKKSRAFTNKRLIYSILAMLGLIWSFVCSAPGVIYILTFIFAGTSLITKFSYKPGKGFYAKLNALLEGIFFGPFMQQGLLLGINCYLLSKIV